MRFSLFCKSFRDDLERFVRLLDSVERHNTDSLPFVLSVPSADLEQFKNRIGTRRVEFLTDEQILGREAKQSWSSQQLVKLYAWRQDFADAWLLVDSDYYFIRAFSKQDFLDDAGRVALVAAAQRHVLDDHWPQIATYLSSGTLPESPVEARLGQAGDARALPAFPRLRLALDGVLGTGVIDKLPRIQGFFGRAGIVRNYMPGPVWTAACLRSMERELLDPRAASFETLIRYSPWESVWVGEWELFRGMPGRFLADSALLHVYKDETILRCREEGLGEQAIAARYLGLQLAARHQRLLELDPLR